MRACCLLLATCTLLLLHALHSAEAKPYLDEDDDYGEEYIDNSINRMYEPSQKRACVRRGGSCDHRPNDCCYNSSCRCNLWGSNCRCQRMGLFQYLRGR